MTKLPDRLDGQQKRIMGHSLMKCNFRQSLQRAADNQSPGQVKQLYSGIRFKKIKSNRHFSSSSDGDLHHLHALEFQNNKITYASKDNPDSICSLQINIQLPLDLFASSATKLLPLYVTANTRYQQAQWIDAFSYTLTKEILLMKLSLSILSKVISYPNNNKVSIAITIVPWWPGKPCLANDQSKEQAGKTQKSFLLPGKITVFLIYQMRKQEESSQLRYQTEQDFLEELNNCQPTDRDSRLKDITQTKWRHMQNFITNIVSELTNYSLQAQAFYFQKLQIESQDGIQAHLLLILSNLVKTLRSVSSLIDPNIQATLFWQPEGQPADKCRISPWPNSLLREISIQGATAYTFKYVASTELAIQGLETTQLNIFTHHSVFSRAASNYYIYAANAGINDFASQLVGSHCQSYATQTISQQRGGAIEQSNISTMPLCYSQHYGNSTLSRSSIAQPLALPFDETLPVGRGFEPIDNTRARSGMTYFEKQNDNENSRLYSY
ncbi:MAG: hypothetical protein EZS28_000490 [Streblomastix strix]|uniref:Uncharacterized protein n=1 Tax=Streblomastix strix TaxID=222440 RepID=A0A5J4XA54_9EUKA|nr:MAG: hypothetical protein EZS28_000490 [Streblomastix strix]